MVMMINSHNLFINQIEKDIHDSAKITFIYS